MPIDIVTIPCLSDNYAYLVSGPAGTWLVDAPEAAPVIAACDARGWGIDAILITHHHHDHVGAVAELREKYGADVIGPAAELAKLPQLNRAVVEGDRFGAAGMMAQVLEVPGHTLGHIAYYLPEAQAAFTADSLMVMGCGRVFEGTMEMMWQSLAKLRSLPPETRIYSGHEYTQANARFALSVEPDNVALQARAKAIAAARARAEPTVPATLTEELATNPFLRAPEPQMQAALGMVGADDVSVFAELRTRKDQF